MSIRVTTATAGHVFVSSPQFMPRECMTQLSTQCQNVFFHYSIYSNTPIKNVFIFGECLQNKPCDAFWMSHSCKKGRNSSHHRRALSLDFVQNEASDLQTANLTQRPLSAGSTCWNMSKGKVSDVGCSVQGPGGVTMP